MNKYFRQKINKTVILIDMIDTITVTLNLYFQSTILKKIIIHSVFQSTRNIRAFSGIDNTLVYKTSLRKFKRIEITSSICSNNNSMKQEINQRKRNGREKKDYTETKQEDTEQPVGQ